MRTAGEELGFVSFAGFWNLLMAGKFFCTE